MRNLFLVLLLANLAFAAWHAWFAKPERPSHLADPNLPSITLVTELPDDEAALSGAAGAVAAEPRGRAEDDIRSNLLSAPAPADATALIDRAAAGGAASPPPESTAATAPARSAPLVPMQPRCTSVGPFRELAQAATAAATLRTAGYEPTQRVADGEIWIGYWVYIDSLPTVAIANEILSKVRAEGVTDSYVIPNSDSGNLVSLGVFSEISGVSRRREQVRALGYEPKVVDRTRRATVYWVDVVLRGDQVLDFDALQTPGRIIRLEQRSCGAPAA